MAYKRNYRSVLLGWALGVLSLAPLPAAAEISREKLSLKIQAATAGEISLDELAELYINEAIAGQRSLEVLLSDERRIQGFPQHLAPLLLQKLNQLLKDGPADQALRLAELGVKMAPQGTPAAQEIADIKKFLESLAEAQKSGSVERFIELTQVEHSGDTAAYEARLATALAELSNGIAAQDDPVRALTELAVLDSATGKPSVTEAGKKALARVEEQIDKNQFHPAEWTLSSQEAQQFLGILVVADEATARAVIKLYEWRILDGIARGDAEGAQWYLNLVIGVRPDPNPANDELRRQIVLRAKGEAAREFAKQRIEELNRSGAAGILTKIRFGLMGYGSGLLQAVFAVLGALIAVVAGFFGVRYLRRWQASRAVRARRPKSKVNRGYQQVTDSDDEYSKLLALFGLDDSATEGDIKRAFRDAVKQYHPDAHGAEGVVRDAEGNIDDTFQELREKYERLLEIRGSWFGRR